MKEVLRLRKCLNINIHSVFHSRVSLGEFLSVMEDGCKKEFLYEIASKIKSGRRYVFSISVVDCGEPHIGMGIVQETFEFTMHEMEGDEQVVKPNVCSAGNLFGICS